MSHKIYTMEAIVLHSKDFGEANRWYFLLTPDFGLIIARAQGVRELKSKLRGHLIQFELTQIVLVRGREFWHLIGAEEIVTDKTPGVGASLTPGVRIPSVTRISALLRRLLPEAGADPELFLLVRQGFARLPEGEVALAWNILHRLGYIKRAEIGDTPESVLIAEINQALSHSQL